MYNGCFSGLEEYVQVKLDPFPKVLGEIEKQIETKKSTDRDKSSEIYTVLGIGSTVA